MRAGEKPKWVQMVDLYEECRYKVEGTEFRYDPIKDEILIISTTGTIKFKTKKFTTLVKWAVDMGFAPGYPPCTSTAQKPYTKYEARMCGFVRPVDQLKGDDPE